MKSPALLFSSAALFLAIISGCDQATSPISVEEPSRLSALVAASEIQLAQASAYSAKSTGWSSSYASAFDGSTATKASGGTTEQWLEFSLGGSYTLTRARIDEDNAGAWELGEWKVQYFNGSAWADCFAYAASNSAAWQQVDFPDAAGATKIRLVANPPAGKTLELEEFECWGYASGPAEYVLSTNLNPNEGGMVTLNPGAASYPPGTVVSLTAAPKTGYYFVNWSGDLSGVTNPTTISMTADKSITANFGSLLYRITSSAGENGSINPFGISDVPYNSSLTYTITPAPGYVVDLVQVDAETGGSISAGISTYTFQNITAPHTIHATFKPGSPAPGTRLTIASSVSGTAQTGNEAVKSYDNTSTTRFSSNGALANAWIQYDLGAVHLVSKVRLLMYNGTSRTYPVTIEVDGVQVFAGNTTVQPAGAYWEQSFTPANGRTVKITMTANNSSKNAYLSIFETELWSSGAPVEFSLSTAAEPAAGGTVTGGGSYAGGAIATVIAAPAAGYIFTGWSGSLTGTANPATITMDAAKSVTANFGLSLYRITASTDGNGTITPSGISDVPYNSSLTYTITPAPGYAVHLVYIDIETSLIVIPGISTYTFENVTAPHSIYVLFKLLPVSQPTKLTIGSSTSGTAQAGNEAVKSYDGLPATRFSSNGTSANAWIQYNLGAVNLMSKVRLLMYNGAARTYPVKIEVDGVQVFAGNTSVQPAGSYWEQSFMPTYGQTVKITMTANNSSNKAYFSIYEAEIHAPQNLLLGPWEFDHTSIEGGAYYIIDGNRIDFLFNGAYVTYNSFYGPYHGFYFTQPVQITIGSRYRLILDATLDIEGPSYFSETSMSGCAAPVMNPADGTVNGLNTMDFEVTSDPGPYPVISFVSTGIFAGSGGSDWGLGVEDHAVTATLIKLP